MSWRKFPSIVEWVVNDKYSHVLVFLPRVFKRIYVENFKLFTGKNIEIPKTIKTHKPAANTKIKRNDTKLTSKLEVEKMHFIDRSKRDIQLP